MKKTIAFMITGALVAATTVTTFAAQNNTRRLITMEENSSLTATTNNENRPELPEGTEFAEGERPELPEGMEAGKYIPKMKPETKPEGEDMVPPEFEGIENIETLGKPEAPEDMNGTARPQFDGGSAPTQHFSGEAPNELPEGMNQIF